MLNPCGKFDREGPLRTWDFVGLQELLEVRVRHIEPLLQQYQLKGHPTRAKHSIVPQVQVAGPARSAHQAIQRAQSLLQQSSSGVAQRNGHSLKRFAERFIKYMHICMDEHPLLCCPRIMQLPFTPYISPRFRMCMLHQAMQLGWKPERRRSGP